MCGEPHAGARRARLHALAESRRPRPGGGRPATPRAAPEAAPHSPPSRSADARSTGSTPTPPSPCTTGTYYLYPTTDGEATTKTRRSRSGRPRTWPPWREAR
ncbi:hypothetical protein HBB16_05895 [Pseudonocardia sp. MCCB 268]|nr:hypothetical protein [Pseudonocardia cytotoxica]